MRDLIPCSNRGKSPFILEFIAVLGAGAKLLAKWSGLCHLRITINTHLIKGMFDGGWLPIVTRERNRLCY